MKNLLIFTAGVCVGRYIKNNKLRIIPFSWHCPIEDCGFKCWSRTPESILDGVDIHKREKHPGRTDFHF